MCEGKPITYIARVRVKAGGVTREGWGGDSSHDHRCRQGAETDAIKRPCGRSATSLVCPCMTRKRTPRMTRGSEPAPTPRPAPSPEYKRRKVINEEVDGVLLETKNHERGAGTDWAD